MTSDGLTLILSGYICQPQTVDMRPFWNGFISLQKKLPKGKPVRQIIVHSWNPELAGLVHTVYEAQAECHETQVCLEPELMQQIEYSIRSTDGVERFESSQISQMIESTLSEACSRSRAVQLMDKFKNGKGQVLLTDWNQGPGEQLQVNQLVVDTALPEEYLYMQYSSDIDEGYPSVWMLAPIQLALHFRNFESFVYDALSGKNSYLELITKKGWPRARIKNFYEKVMLYPYGRRIHASVSNIVLAINSWSQGDTLLQKIIRRLIGRLHRFLTRPPITAENSCIHGYERNKPVYSALHALNIHSVLKYFILSKGLRNRTRFLTDEDFELTSQSGQFINPQPFVLLVQDSDAAVERLLEESPMPYIAIYQLYQGLVKEYMPDKKREWIVRKLQSTNAAHRDQVVCALNAAIPNSLEDMPVLLMPSVVQYLACTDWYYLNALMKYIAWRNIDYIGLEHTHGGSPSIDFPNLQIVQSADAFSLHMAAGTVKGILKYLHHNNNEEQQMDPDNDMLLEFPVVVRGENLF